MENLNLIEITSKAKIYRRHHCVLTLVIVVLFVLCLGFIIADKVFIHFFQDHHHKEESIKLSGSSGVTWTIGGDEDNSVEIIDIGSSDDRKCKPIPNLTFRDKAYGAFGFLNEDGRPVVCCGRNENKCISWTGSEWQDHPTTASNDTRLELPIYPGVALFDRETLWITGGKSVHSNATVPTSLFFKTKYGFAPGPRLPESRFGHCLVSLSNSGDDNGEHSGHLLVGGKPFTKAVHIFSRGQWYQQVPISNARHGSACAKVNLDSGTSVVVVAGGYNLYGSSSDVDMFSLKTLEWTRGTTKLPFPLHYGAAVPRGNTFLILGGNGANGTRHKDILKYDPARNAWKLLGPRMAIPRVYFLAMSISESQSC
ncbi:hypothetical protein TCAL_07496 [Tigriopus californicus]|uniref:Uncharacterized protein n=1 Tax=Tigriopus californicus TaxID=6832 RepID=A0A553PCS5_TIGCA|nr:uncharacterized protein LOC131876959 [Tigriopus californicus]TRY75468.1 hypothetical protein TCAL_07496 [Tigriopus californicus]|eukprot:TCALIF_07496-PA protein Name:"Protein of unknown function" AED:0.11 eAED:0.11 QI:322/1/0.75/1/0.33/0.25/4/0/367